MSKDSGYVLDMLHAVRLAGEFVAGMTVEQFGDDVKTQSAVLHQLTVLGEAVRRISTTFRDEHPAIPWKAIAGFRSKIVHDYDEIDLDVVWHIVVHDLRALQPDLERLVGPEPK